MRVAVIGDSEAEKLGVALKTRGYTPVLLGARVSKIPSWVKVLFVKTKIPPTDRAARAWGGEDRSHCLIYYKSVGEAMEGLAALTDAPWTLDYSEEQYLALSDSVRKKGTHPFLMNNARLAALEFSLVPRRLKEQAIRTAQKALHAKDLRDTFALELLSQYAGKPVLFGALWCLLQGDQAPRVGAAERIYAEVHGKKTNYGTMRLSMEPILYAKAQAAMPAPEPAPAPEPDEAVPAVEEPAGEGASPAARSFQESRIRKLEEALAEANTRAEKHASQLDSLREMNTSLMDQIARAHTLLDQSLVSQEQLRRQGSALRKAFTAKTDELESFVRKQARSTALVTNSNIKMVEERLRGLISGLDTGGGADLRETVDRIKLMVEEQLTVPAPDGKGPDPLEELRQEIGDLKVSISIFRNEITGMEEQLEAVNRAPAVPSPGTSLGSAIDRVLEAGGELKFKNSLKG